MRCLLTYFSPLKDGGQRIVPQGVRVFFQRRLVDVHLECYCAAFFSELQSVQFHHQRDGSWVMNCHRAHLGGRHTGSGCGLSSQYSIFVHKSQKKLTDLARAVDLTALHNLTDVVSKYDNLVTEGMISNYTMTSCELADLSQDAHVHQMMIDDYYKIRGMPLTVSGRRRSDLSTKSLHGMHDIRLWLRLWDSDLRCV